MTDRSRGIARKRVELGKTYEELSSSQKSSAFEVRASFLVDISQFNVEKLGKLKGVHVCIPSKIQHFGESERQREWARDSQRKRRGV